MNHFYLLVRNEAGQGSWQELVKESPAASLLPQILVSSWQPYPSCGAAGHRGMEAHPALGCSVFKFWGRSGRAGYTSAVLL